MTTETPIKLEHVTLRYGDVRALDDVTLEVAAGQRVCVLGANGSGKSTLASVVCGLLAPDEGSVELVGERVCVAAGGATADETGPAAGNGTCEAVTAAGNAGRGIDATDSKVGAAPADEAALAESGGAAEADGAGVAGGGTAPAARAAVPDLEAYRRARRGLGLVFQNPDDQIVTSVVADDVAFGPENLGLPREEILARVERELKRVALTDHATSDPSRMSGGQRQRVCIAGALAMEPQVLVLDEPSSLLDVRGREAILRVMGRLRAAGTTLVHVTHFMDEALEADRVIVMDRGRVALDGAPAEVFCEANAVLIDKLGLELPFEMRLARARKASATRAGSAGADDRADADVRADADDRAGADGHGDAAGRVGADVRADADGQDDACETSASPAPKDATCDNDQAGQAVLGAVVCEARDVDYSYKRGKKALDGVSFDVRRGESMAIVGQTGSGKSTLLRLMCGLEAPDAGSIVVAGSSTAKKRGRRAVRRAVGYVMQHPERQLFAQTVAEDVAFGPRNLGLRPEEVARRVDHALELVGLADKRGASPFELSGGQRRLAAIAGVLAMEPELLILDEPTAGLDPRGRARLRELLADLRAHGVTLVQVTHSMEDAARADRVVVLDRSRVITNGAPAEVFSRTNEAQLTACGLGIPKPLAHARELEAAGHAPLGDPLTIEALAAALNATEGAGFPAVAAPETRETTNATVAAIASSAQTATATNATPGARSTTPAGPSEEVSAHGL